MFSLLFDSFRHFNIDPTADGHYCMGTLTFQNIEDAIYHYQQNSLFIHDGQRVTLGQPVRRRTRPSESIKQHVWCVCLFIVHYFFKISIFLDSYDCCNNIFSCKILRVCVSLIVNHLYIFSPHFCTVPIWLWIIYCFLLSKDSACVDFTTM